MNKRKVRFNFIDLLILLLVASAVFVILYVFVLSDRNASEPAQEEKTIQYVVEFLNVDERFDEIIKKEQPVQDAIRRKAMGTVVGVEPKDFEKITFSQNTGEEILSNAEGRRTIYVTIETKVVETKEAFMADGVAIRVGEQYSLIFPEFYGVGFCTFLKVMGES